MRKFWVYIPWSTRNVIEIEVVKETPRRYYIKYIRTVWGPTNWVPAWVDKDTIHLHWFDTAEEALQWCESDAALTLGKAQQAFINRMTELKEARAKI